MYFSSLLLVEPRSVALLQSLRLMRTAVGQWCCCCRHNAVHAAAAGSPGRVLRATNANAAEAARVLREGGVVAVPTDTIYGIAAHAGINDSVSRLWDLKGRPTTLPIAVAVHDVDAIARCARVEHLPQGLLHALLPGPVTVLLPRLEGKSAELASTLNPGVSTIGVRVPHDDFIRVVLAELKAPVALTSANASGASSTLAVDEFEHMWPNLDAVFDGGRIASGRSGSTIVDLTDAKADGTPWNFRVVRDGSALSPTVETVQKYGGVRSHE